VAREHGLEGLQDRPQNGRGGGEGETAEHVYQPSFRLIRRWDQLRLDPTHTGKSFEDIAHFLRRRGNLAICRVANRSDLH
jgi:hypothetical protein